MGLNARLRIAVLQRDGYTCIYCGRRPPEVALEVDHVLPRSMGGQDVATNLVTACRDCNGGKSDALIALPQGYTPQPVGFLRRVSTVLRTAGDCPADLRFAADHCPQCGELTLPLTFVDGDALEVELGYRCSCVWEWQATWSPKLARIHAQSVRWLS